MNMEAILAVLNSTKAVVKIRPEKNSGLMELTSVILVQCFTT